MARFIKKYECPNKGGVIMNQINTYLTAQGYIYKNYNGEMVYCKGNGYISNPKYFKIQRIDDCITVEGWMKWILVPFISVGEIDFSINSLVGTFSKKKMQTDLTRIEKIIAQYSYNDLNGSNGWNAKWSDMITGEWHSHPNNHMFDREIDTTEQTVGFDNISVDYTEKTMGFGNNFSHNPVEQRKTITKDEYINNYADEKIIKNINIAAIVGYVCLGITAITGIIALNMAVLLEVIIMLGFLLGMHLGKKKWCAMVFMCIAILDCVVSLIFAGRPSGWMVIIAGIWAVNSFNKLDKAYSTFVQNGYKNK